MKKAVIFDLDGTLLNTLDSIAYCGNLALEHFGMGQIPTAVFPDFVGMGAKVLIEKIFKYVNGDPEIFHEFYEYYIDIYNKNGLHGVKPYSGIGELLDALSARGIKTAVLSIGAGIKRALCGQNNIDAAAVNGAATGGSYGKHQFRHCLRRG